MPEFNLFRDGNSFNANLVLDDGQVAGRGQSELNYSIAKHLACQAALASGEHIFVEAAWQVLGGNHQTPKTKTTEERLQELLDAKDAELRVLQASVERLSEELAEAKGEEAPKSENIQDDVSLPIPRLELAYRQLEGWSRYEVTYRLVMKHLLGHVYAVPLGVTVCDQSSETPPEEDDYPFRDGAHAAHDAGHLGLHLYKVLPDQRPVRASIRTWSACKLGVEHRRDVNSTR